MAAQSTGKIEELESIRGIAAVLVVLFHMPTWNRWLTDIRFIQNSYYMVDLFFVLSGFVMNLNYGDRLHGVRDLTRFQFLRLRRPESIADGISTPQLSLWAACLWYGIAVGGTIVLSALVFKFVEDPFRLKSKEFARRYLAPSRGGVVGVVVVENRR